MGANQVPIEIPTQRSSGLVPPKEKILLELGTPSRGPEIVAYADGSYRRVHQQALRRAYGVAAIGVYFPGMERCDISRIVLAASSGEAEAIACLMALRRVGQGPNVRLFCDCQDVISAMRDCLNGTRAPRNTAISMMYDLALSRTGKTEIMWSPGHADTYGNDQAHELADIASLKALNVLNTDKDPAQVDPLIYCF